MAALPRGRRRGVVGPGAERARPRPGAGDRAARGARRLPGDGRLRAREPEHDARGGRGGDGRDRRRRACRRRAGDGDAVVLLRLPVRRRRRSGPRARPRGAAARRPGRTRSCSPTPSAPARRARRPGWCATRSPPRRASRSACTCTTPATRAMPTPTPGSRPARRCSTRRSAASAAVRSRRAPPGNIATEDLVYLLDGLGVEHGCDLDELIRVSEWLEGVLGHELPGLLHRAGRLPRLRRLPACTMAGRWRATRSRCTREARTVVEQRARCRRPGPVRGPLPRPAPRPAPADRAAAQRRERPRSTRRTRSCATC